MAGAGLGIVLIPAPLAQVAIPGLIYRGLDSKALSANLMLVQRRRAGLPDPHTEYGLLKG